MSRLPSRDLDEVTERGGTTWRALAGAGVLITGAAGFVGSWLLESLLHATRALGIPVSATALVRDVAGFRQRHPALAADPRLSLVAGDVRRLRVDAPPTHIVHCASATTPDRHALDPGDIIGTIDAGTRRVLEVAAESGTRRTLVVSSGSVYDRRAIVAPRIDEEAATLLEGTTLAERFGAAKRRAERQVEASGVDASVARIFSVVGPRLPIDGQFAVGQFFGDALAHRPVRVAGDGSPVRTYLYAADLAAWCWAILLRGRSGRAYNVGSEQEVTIGDVADRVARLHTPHLAVTRGDAIAGDRYVPDTRRAREELGVEAWTSLDTGLARSWAWLRARPS